MTTLDSPSLLNGAKYSGAALIFMRLLIIKLGFAVPEAIRGTSSDATCEGKTMPSFTCTAFWKTVSISK
jgi:hypothetical protein